MKGCAALSAESKDGVLAAISKALRAFGELPLDGSGALAQAWMPVSTPEGAGTVLQTKGLPYCLVGPGDMLALFRCLSCKYSFTADLNQLSLMGAPGRVFLSGEAETSDKVDQCNVSIYLRVRDAQACRVSSTVLLPVFAEPNRTNAVAVLEITQFNGTGVSYQTVFDWARRHLEAVGLFAPKQLETRTFEMQSHALSIRFFSSRDSALGCLFNDNGALDSSGLVGRGADNTSASFHRAQGLVSEEAETPKAKDLRRGLPDGNSGDDQQTSGDSEDGNEDDSPRSEGQKATGDEQWEPRGGAGSQSKATLTKEDLERHFGLGLKEAAQRLGVCNTTLKRACRRHGIMKWPRRELLKAAKQKEATKKTRSNSPSRLSGHQLRLQLVPGGPFQAGSKFKEPQARVQTKQPATSNQLANQQKQSSSFTPALSGPCHVLPDPKSFLPPVDEVLYNNFSKWRSIGASMQPASSQPASDKVVLGREPDSSRRSSLGFVDTIFTEGEPPELGAILGDAWEQQLSNFDDGKDGPRAMEGVIDAAMKHPGSSSLSGEKDIVRHFPEIPEAWPLEQGTDSHAWEF